MFSTIIKTAMEGAPVKVDSGRVPRVALALSEVSDHSPSQRIQFESTVDIEQTVSTSTSEDKMS